MKLIAQSFLLLFCATSAFAQTAEKPVSKNLLFEGNFAEHNSVVPAGWSEGGYAGGNHGNTTKVTEDRDGNYVSLFIKKTETAFFLLNLNESILLKPTWKSLLCSVDIRAFNLVIGDKSYHRPRLHLSFLDASDKELETLGVSITSGRYIDSWQTAERSVPIPTGAVKVKVALGTFGSTGQIDFRNPYIAPVE